MFDFKVRPATCLPRNSTQSAALTNSLQNKAKYNAWKKLVEDGVTPEQAETKYIALIEELKTKYGFDASKAPETVGA